MTLRLKCGKHEKPSQTENKSNYTQESSVAYLLTLLIIIATTTAMGKFPDF